MMARLLKPTRIDGESKMQYMARLNIPRTPHDYARIERAVAKRNRKRFRAA